ncbi:universal stress protein [Candidatus Binatia bacterium]|nr:universal stress protein [Candidatus Binatia bacterium]
MFEYFTRILVTTDFSEAGNHAVDHAFRIAADQEAEVLLCHVFEALVVPNPMYAQYYPSDVLGPDARERAEIDARNALIECVPKTGPLAGVRYRTVVAHGMPAEEIIRVAEQEGVDLVVIATKGRTGLRHLLLGSVAERVVRHAHCPVLVVR